MIIVIFGPPGSGKTTIAARLVGCLDGAYHISSEQLKRRVYRRLTEKVRVERVRWNYLVVEGTFYKQKWREELRNAAGDEETLEVFINCPLETCLKRNRERKSPIPEAAVNIIWKEFERPERPGLLINSDDVTVEEAVPRILELLRGVSVKA